MFGEKEKEWHAKLGKKIPVCRTPKYEESRRKAIEIINSGKYGLLESDFWILMNATKSGEMAYTGLIISHNGCLKINDKLDKPFDPSCVSVDKDGYGDSLVYQYCCKEQGLYEVGEVSRDNLQNAYPYAMAFKRLFDRVVLKLSKLAYAGIYSDSESDEFVQQAKDVLVNGEDLPTYKAADKTNDKADGQPRQQTVQKAGKAGKDGIGEILSAAGGDKDAALNACKKFGYRSSADVLAKDVDEICNYLYERVPWEDDK